MQKTKKIFSLLLSLCLFLSAVPMFGLTAFADELPNCYVDADNNGSFDEGETGFASIGEAIEAMTNEGTDTFTIRLLADFTENVTVPEYTYVTLDINGHILSGDGTESVIIVGVQSASFFTSEYDCKLWLIDSDPQAVHTQEKFADIQGGIITGGYTSVGGGGVYNKGKLLYIDGLTICYNSTSLSGGGIRNETTAYIKNCTVTNNTSTKKGGGIYNNEYMLLQGCTITGNISTLAGGGVSTYYNPGNKCVIMDTVITGNAVKDATGEGIEKPIGGGGVYIGTADTCFVAGTLISMADGSTKKVEDVEVGDVVKTFDHESGTFSSAEVYIAWKENIAPQETFTLNFDGGYTITCVASHCFLEKNSRKYVTFDVENALSYVGQSFFAQDGKWHELLSVTYNGTTESLYEIYTAKHQNAFANGMLTLPADVDYLLNIYDLDENLKADAVQLANDIEQYGLVDYEYAYEMCGMSREWFDAAGTKYVFIAIGKGLATFEYLQSVFGDVEGEAQTGTDEKALPMQLTFAEPAHKLAPMPENTQGTEPSLDDYNADVLTLGKNVIVKENTYSVIEDETEITTESNIYLPEGKLIELAADHSGLSAGVTLEKIAGKATVNGTADDDAYLFSDNKLYTVKSNDNNTPDNETDDFLEILPVAYAPIYAFWTDASVDIPEDAVFTFKIEAVTEGAPLPKNTTVTLTAPEVKGKSNKVGYSSDDAENPWKIAFSKEGIYEYKVTQTTKDSFAFVCDTQEYSLYAIVNNKRAVPAQFKMEWEEVTLSAAEFQVCKGNEDTEMAVTAQNGVTTLTLGGGDNAARNEAEKYNVGIAKSTQAFDFSKNFIISGTLDMETVPDGTVFGFVPNGDAITTPLNDGGCLAVYWHPQFANGLFVEFDSFCNENEFDGVIHEEDERGIINSHIDIVKTDSEANPTQLARLYGFDAVDEVVKYNTLFIENDATAKKLSITIVSDENELNFVYDYSGDSLTEAYFVFGGVERYDTAYNLDENNLELNLVPVTEINITSIQYFSNFVENATEVIFGNTANQKYAVTKATCQNGSVSVAKAKYYPGETVTLSGTPDTGYVFEGYTVYKTGNKNTKVDVTDSVFIMPAYAVTVEANFKKLYNTDITVKWAENYTPTAGDTVAEALSKLVCSDEINLTYEPAIYNDSLSPLTDTFVLEAGKTYYLGGFAVIKDNSALKFSSVVISKAVFYTGNIVVLNKSFTDGCKVGTDIGFGQMQMNSAGTGANDKVMLFKTTDIPSFTAAAITHDWKVSYEWNDDFTACTATRTCQKHTGETDNSQATVTVVPTTPAECTKDGEATVTATFAKEWAITQYKTLPLKATGHTDKNNDLYCDVCKDFLGESHSVTIEVKHNLKINILSGLTIENNKIVSISGDVIADENGCTTTVTYHQPVTESIRFTVEADEDFIFDDYKVTVNGVRIYPDGDGVYTVEGSLEDIKITVSGAVKQNDDQNLSLWERIYQKIRSILQYMVSLLRWGSNSASDSAVECAK